MLVATSSQAVSDCATTTYAGQSWEYDHLAAGSVSAGLVTAHIVERHDDTGALLGTIRRFDATFDATGNPSTVSTTREDGATRTVTVTYDPFGLAVTSVAVTSPTLATLTTSIVRDPVTLAAQTVTDPNGTQHGSTFDGFERPVLSTVTPPGGARSTWQGATRLEHAMFSYDRLGHRTGMTRYQDAAAGANPVTSSWHFDSLGQLLELDEPGSAPSYHTYSDWGELIRTLRDAPGDPSSTALSVVSRYDAFGRLIHREQQTDGAADAATVNDYQYDQPVAVAPNLNPTNVLGRLAQASAPTGTTSFSYDALGQVNGRVFTDNAGGLYVEQRTTHADGSPASLDLLLPDTGFADEHVDYAYDSAGRGTSVRYSSGAETIDLFEASTIDPLGRLRQAQFGATSYSASYADLGRRLLTEVTASSLMGSRSIRFGGFDPVGRERSRTEIKNGAGTGTTTTFTYDPLGQLSHAVKTAGATTLFDQRTTYDPLGNLLTLSDAAAGAGPTTTTLSYLDSDRDRICHIAYGTDSDTACNVTYDEIGSILSQQTSTGTRQHSYYIDGSVRTIHDDQGSAAQFRYDAFGQVQELDLTSNVSHPSGLFRVYDIQKGLEEDSTAGTGGFSHDAYGFDSHFGEDTYVTLTVFGGSGSGGSKGSNGGSAQHPGASPWPLLYDRQTREWHDPNLNSHFPPLEDRREDTPGLIDRFINDLDETWSGFLASIVNGIFDVSGAQHPGHATATAELKPGVHILTSITVNGGLLVLGGELLPEARLAELADEVLVVRGGTCTAERFASGSGVTVDGAGKLSGVSVNSAPGKTLKELTTTILNGQVGVSIVGKVRAAGGNVIPNPTPKNPLHCQLCGITPEKAEELFTPTVRNPNARR